MSFGFSVGDFIAVIKLADGLRKRFVKAPEQYKTMKEDLRTLSIVLMDVEDIFPHRELSQEQAHQFYETHQDCVAVLQELEGKLVGFGEVGSSGRDFHNKLRNAWKRLQWNQREFKEVQDRLESTIERFRSFRELLNCNVNFEIKSGVDRLNKREDDRQEGERRKAILHWLSVVDHDSQQSDVLAKRQPKTGNWLLTSSDFETWLDQSGTCLLCSGVPGTGKTIMSAIIVDHLQAKQQQGSNIGLAYFFFNYQSYKDQTHDVVMRSMVRQLLQTSKFIPEILLVNHEKVNRNISMEDLRRAFITLTKTYDNTYIVLDALDEYYSLDPAKFKSFILSLLNLQQSNGMQLLATCRPISDILSLFPNCLNKQIYAHEEDVELYLDSRMGELLFGKIDKYPDLRRKVKSSILGAIDGMFLLARLHMDSLGGEPRTKDLEKALSRLPYGTKKLKETYDQALTRIKETRAGKGDLARNILKWVVYSERPLLIQELVQILAVDSGDTSFDKDSCPPVEALDSLCAGLVTVDNSTHIVRVVHKTAQEYFERHNIFPNVHTELWDLCMTYMAFDEIYAEFSDDEFDYEFPFYRYACNSWDFHARLVGPGRISDNVVLFFENSSKVSCCYSFFGRQKRPMIDSDQRPSMKRKFQPSYLLSGIHLAARHDLVDLMTVLIERGQSPNLQSQDGCTPLMYAVTAPTSKSKAVEVLLHEHNADPNVILRDFTALLIAIRYQRWGSVRLLLDDNRITLHEESSSRYTGEARSLDMAKLILEHPRKIITFQDVEKLLFPRFAVYDPWVEFAGVIVAHKKFVFDKTNQRIEASRLFSTANKFFESGNHTAGSLILKKCYSSNDEQNSRSLDRPILYHAVMDGVAELVDELITHHGADHHWKDHDDATLCHISTRNCRSNVFDLLVTKFGLDPEARDKSQRTPLQLLLSEILIPRITEYPYQCEIKYRAAKELLTNHNLNFETKDINGRTPLMNFISALNMQRSAIKMCKPHDYDLFLLENSLIWYDCASFLINKKHASCTLRDNEGNTLLSLCVDTTPSEESNAFVRSLLRYPGVIVDANVLGAANTYLERPRPELSEELSGMLEAKVAEQERGDSSNDQSQDISSTA